MACSEATHAHSTDALVSCAASDQRIPQVMPFICPPFKLPFCLYPSCPMSPLPKGKPSNTRCGLHDSPLPFLPAVNCIYNRQRLYVNLHMSSCLCLLFVYIPASSTICELTNLDCGAGHYELDLVLPCHRAAAQRLVDAAAAEGEQPTWRNLVWEDLQVPSSAGPPEQWAGIIPTRYTPLSPLCPFFSLPFLPPQPPSPMSVWLRSNLTNLYNIFEFQVISYVWCAACPVTFHNHITSLPTWY